MFEGLSYDLKQSPIPFDFWKERGTFGKEQNSSLFRDKPEHVLFLSQQCKFAAPPKVKNYAFSDVLTRPLVLGSLA